MSKELTQEDLRWFRRKMKAWAKSHLRDFYWRRTKDPYELLIAEILLQQTDAPKVVPVYEKFLHRYPNLSALAEAPLTEIESVLKPLGLRYRAKRLKRIAETISGDPVYAGSIPANENLLMKLPGVGRYVARSVCSNAFGQSLAILDTNIVRILGRVFNIRKRRARARDDKYLWEIAQQAAPKNDVSLWNMTLLDFGALVCKFHNPLCPTCPLRSRCHYFAYQKKLGLANSTQ